MAGGETIGEINELSYTLKDLLHSFNFEGKKAVEDNSQAEEEEEEEGIELSLGLSLNGRFGVDPKRDNNIIRASSISNFPNDSGAKDCAEYDGVLIRSYSLPVETEEEWRKRKELQSLKRLEAKRRRMDKLKNVREKVSKEIVGPPTLKFSSQGSIGSQGSGAASSGLSDLESPVILVTGTNKTPEEGSPANGQSSTEQRTDKPAEAVVENPSPKPAPVGSQDKEKETENKMVGHMPCVSTTGDGPNGTKINGFLYRYGNGEEVKIICVCHGSFLSPAEFVKHSGGGDVEHPLKHIIINPPLL